MWTFGDKAISFSADVTFPRLCCQVTLEQQIYLKLQVRNVNTIHQRIFISRSEFVFRTILRLATGLGNTERLFFNSNLPAGTYFHNSSSQSFKDVPSLNSWLKYVSQDVSWLYRNVMMTTSFWHLIGRLLNWLVDAWAQVGTHCDN